MVLRLAVCCDTPYTHSSPLGYTSPTCHPALDQAVSVPRGAGFQPAWRHHRHRRQGWPWPLVRRHKSLATYPSTRRDRMHA
jgi:hypothetical protein